jgi:hypothetical protein
MLLPSSVDGVGNIIVLAVSAVVAWAAPAVMTEG